MQIWDQKYFYNEWGRSMADSRLSSIYVMYVLVHILDMTLIYEILWREKNYDFSVSMEKS